MHPARLGQQGQSLGQGDQQPIDQQGREPAQQDGIQRRGLACVAQIYARPLKWPIAIDNRLKTLLP
jgi:hypothetical protein